MNVGALLSNNAVRVPTKCAIVEGEKKVSYREINESVNRIANGLLDLNIRKGDKASIYVNSPLKFAQLYFALSKIGVLIVPINHNIKKRELVHIVSHSDSVVLFFDEETIKNVELSKMDMPGVNFFVFLGNGASGEYISYSDLLQKGDNQEPTTDFSMFDDHSICYTSGTTGLPKGVILTQFNVVSCHYYVTSSEFGVTHDDVFLATTPLSQRIGWGKLVNSVALGCTLIAMPHFDAQEAMKIVERGKVTILSIIPTIGRRILELPNLKSYDTSSLKSLFVTGEAFSFELKKRLIETFPGVKIVTYFASTEAAIIASIRHEDILKKPTSVGHPLPGVEIRIVDHDDKDLSVDQAGEILTRCGGPGMITVMKEYYKNPEQTKEVLKDGWLYTGDVGKLDDEGYLYVVDRKKDMIISGGFNIYSREVEAILESNPKVKEVAVIGIPDAKFGEAVKAFVVLKPGESATEEEIVEYCKANLASYKKPKYVEFVNDLPRSLAGKLQKYKLRQISQQMFTESSGTNL